jgi:hypothetical protein
MRQWHLNQPFVWGLTLTLTAVADLPTLFSKAYKSKRPLVKTNWQELAIPRKISAESL